MLHDQEHFHETASKIKGVRKVGSSNKKKLEKYLKDEKFRVQSECGISLVKSKLQIINVVLSRRYKRDVIMSRTDRIKSYESVVDKLKRKGLPEEVGVVKEQINDLVGVRAVCAYEDDIYRVADMLCEQKDVRLVNTKDYIKEPKASGYRSLHLIIEVPICLGHETKWVKIEVQIRTSAMDYWAGLDYQLQYKKENQKTDAIEKELKEYAKVIQDMDQKIMDLRKRIEEI